MNKFFVSKAMPFAFVALSCIASAVTASSESCRSVLDDMRAYCTTSNYSRLNYVKEYGFAPQSYNDSLFISAVNAISNDWQCIMLDWDHYWTNEEMRILLPKLAGFAGTNALVQIWSSLLAILIADADKCSLDFITSIYNPSSTPLEYYAFKHYDDPTISNLLMRTLALYPPSDAEARRYFNGILSGKRKRNIEFLENWDNVSFEYVNAQLTNSVPQ